MIKILLPIFLFFSNAAFASDEALEEFKDGNYDRAFRISYMSEQLGSRVSNEDAIVLGKIYLNGFGNSKQDVQKGLEYLTKASSNGSLSSALYLAEQYEFGGALDQDLLEALKFYSLAQELGASNLEQKIALISTEVSGGELNLKSCESIIAAANKGQVDFYISAGKCEAKQFSNLTEAAIFFRKAFAASEPRVAADILGYLLDQSEAFYAPDFALELALSIKPSGSRDRIKYVDEILSEVEYSADERQFKDVLEMSINSYFKNNLSLDTLLQIIKIGLRSRDPRVSDFTISNLSSRLEATFNEADLDTILLSVIADPEVSRNKKIAFIDIEKNRITEVLNSTRTNSNSLISYISDRADAGLCTAATEVFDNPNFELALLAAEILAENATQCKDGNYEIFDTAFSNYPRPPKENATSALKQLCADDLKNACHALGLMFKANLDSQLDSIEARELANAAFETAAKLNNAYSFVELALSYAQRNEQKALSYARNAYSSGLIEGKYAEGVVSLGNVFFASASSCKPLMVYLASADVGNRYYDEAKALQKKKRCKN